MTNFMDLPKPVREKIYRLHLVAEKQPVDFEAYKKICGYTETWTRGVRKPTELKCPSLLLLSSEVEKEASPIFFGENTFCLRDATSLSTWKRFTLPYHLKQVRKIAISVFGERYASTGISAFTAFNSLPKLECLTVRIDEQKCLEMAVAHHEHTSTNREISWHPCLGFGPQLDLQSLRLDGVAGLRFVRGLREIKFVKDLNISNDDLKNVGSMSGGFLETVVRREVLQTRSPQKPT